MLSESAHVRLAAEYRIAKLTLGVVRDADLGGAHGGVSAIFSEGRGGGQRDASICPTYLAAYSAHGVGLGGSNVGRSGDNSAGVRRELCREYGGAAMVMPAAAIPKLSYERRGRANRCRKTEVSFSDSDVGGGIQLRSKSVVDSALWVAGSRLVEPYD